MEMMLIKVEDEEQKMNREETVIKEMNKGGLSNKQGLIWR